MGIPGGFSKLPDSRMAKQVWEVFSQVVPVVSHGIAFCFLHCGFQGYGRAFAGSQCEAKVLAHMSRGDPAKLGGPLLI